MIQAIKQKYNDWTAKLEQSGRLVGLNNRRDE